MFGRIAAITTYSWFSLLSVCLGQIPAEYHDDFSNAESFSMNWTTVDSASVDFFGSPRNAPKPWGPGIAELVDGSLNLRTSHPVALGDSLQFPAGDQTVFDTDNAGLINAFWNPSLVAPVHNATVRTQIRADTLSQSSILLRAVNGSGYAFTASGSTRQFGISRFDSGELGRVETDPNLVFVPGEDWWLEASADGDQLALKAWKVGEVEPSVPQILWTDDTHLAGGVALSGAIWNNNISEPTAVNVRFDRVAITGVSAIPEPSAWAMITIGLACSISIGRRVRRTSPSYGLG